MPIPTPALKPPLGSSGIFTLPDIQAHSLRVRDIVTAVLTQQKAISALENGVLEFHLGTPGKDRDVKMKIQAFVTYAT